MAKTASPDVTDLETRILQAVAQAGGRRLTVEELAQQLSCTSEAIYKRLQKDAFRQLFLDVHRNCLAGEVAPVLSAFVTEARRGSFKHGKIVLEIAGLYVEQKPQTTVNVNVTTEQPFKDPAERQRFAAATLGTILPGFDTSLAGAPPSAARKRPGKEA